MLSRVAPSGGFRVPRYVRMHRVLPVAAVLLLALCMGGMAGCGVAGGANSGGDAASRSTSTATPASKAVVMGCALGAAGTVSVGAPAIVLTLKDAEHKSTVRVGDVIQVRLPTTQRWTAANGGTGTLEALQPAGYWDMRASACVWNFRAMKAGATTLSFVGTALCEPMQPCPAYAIAEEFPVTVA